MFLLMTKILCGCKHLLLSQWYSELLMTLLWDVPFFFRIKTAVKLSWSKFWPHLHQYNSSDLH